MLLTYSIESLEEVLKNLALEAVLQAYFLKDSIGNPYESMLGGSQPIS